MPESPTETALDIPELNNTPAISNDDKALIAFYLTLDEVLRLAANTLRDGSWAATSALGINVRGKETVKFWSETGAQVAFSIPAPFLLSIVSICISNKVSPKKALASFLALTLAIITWNLGQYYGEQFFSKKYNLSDKNAGYSAALSTGLAEGVIQAFVYDAVLALCGDEETKAPYKLFCSNPLHACLFFANYLLTSSLGGAVWQLIYNAIFPNCTNTPSDCTDSTIKNVLFVAFTVGLGVAATNYVSGVALKASVRCQGLNSLFTSSSAEVQPDNLAARFLDATDTTASEFSLATD